MLTDLEKKVAEELYKIGAIKFGEFRLKLHDREPTAPLSPFYINLRVIRSFPAALDLVTDLYIDLLKPLQFTAIADVPTAAGPIVAVVCYKTGTPMISPRLGGKQHGIGSSVDGSYTAGETVVVVDDLVTQADSKLEAIAVLEREKLVIRDVAVLVDRQQGGGEQLQKAGYRLHSSFPLERLLRFYRESDLLSPDIFEKCMSYLRSSQAR